MGLYFGKVRVSGSDIRGFKGVADGVDGVIASQCNQFVGQAKNMVNGTIGKYTGSASINNFMGGGNNNMGQYFRNVGDVRVNTGLR